jgi:hypothetical protein
MKRRFELTPALAERILTLTITATATFVAGYYAALSLHIGIARQRQTA